MLEQDVQLTRLIVEKLTELDQRKQQVGWQLSEAQERLDRVETLKSQRSAYEGVLERAAALLGRDDLVVEIDVPVDDAKLAEDLRTELSAINAEQSQYLELVDELRHRAPDLLQAAAGMAPESLQALFGPLDSEGHGAAETVQAGDSETTETSDRDWATVDTSPAAVADLAEPEDADHDLEEDEEESDEDVFGPAAEQVEDDEDTEQGAGWSVPAFRPQASVDSEPALEPSVHEQADTSFYRASASGQDETDSVEPVSVNESPAYASIDAQANGGSALTESSFHWPAIEAEAELPATPASSASAWDDDVEVVSTVNYAELEMEAANGNGHHVNGSNGNGHHASAQDEADLDARNGFVIESTADTEDSPQVSFGGFGSEEADAVAALGYSEPQAEEPGLAHGAAGYLMDSEENQPLVAAAFSESDFSSDFDRVPAFAADDDYNSDLSPAATAVAVEEADAREELEALADESSREEDTRERLLRLARFSHTQTSRRIEGEQPIFVIDATAVLERIPHYDRYHLALDETAARDELVRDFSFLAADLNTEFHLVFNDPHVPGFSPDPHVVLEHGDVNSSDPNPGDQRIQEIVLDYIENDRQVALVTSDPTLQGLFKGENVLVFSLGEFFLT